MIDELNKYTFTEFTALPQDERDLYKAFGLHLKAKNITDKATMDWEWGRIKQIQDLINQPSLSYDDLAEIIALAAEKDKVDVLQMYWTDVFPFYNFILKEIQAINEKEQQLSYEPDAREQNAGVERYQAFSWFATMNRLSGGDPLKYDAIGRQPYAVIFSTLLLQKVDREYEKALIKQNTQSHV